MLNNFACNNITHTIFLIIQINSCFALTEFAHGTNSKGLRTTATYEPKTQTFILHSPDFEAAKCWVGNMGM